MTNEPSVNSSVNEDEIFKNTEDALDVFIENLEFPWNFIINRHHYMMTGTMLIGKIVGLLPFIPWVVVFLPTIVAILIINYMFNIVFTLTLEEENDKLKESNLSVQKLPEDVE